MSQNRIRKRKRKTSVTDRKKNVIVNRLMEISLQADNYIYCHQPLSVHKAASYLREVLSFQTSCWNDERCLQVIEKLARIMQGIIQEQDTHQKHSSVYDQQENFGGGELSPVYSLAEEDKLEFTCKHADISTEFCPSIYKYKTPNLMHYSKELRPYKPKEKNQNDIADLQLKINENTQCCKQLNEVNYEIQETNNTELNSCNNYIQQLDNSDEEIAMVINDLTLTQKDIQFHEDNFLCSPSILNNESLVQTLIIDEKCGQGPSEFDRAVTKLLDPNQTTTITYQGRCNKAKPSHKTQKYNNYKNTLQSQSKRVINKNVKRKTHKTNAKKDNTIAKTKNKHVNKICSPGEDTLSWLGTIKLVRQIDREEYSVNALDESFWQNCELPTDWNDKHFD